MESEILQWTHDRKGTCTKHVTTEAVNKNLILNVNQALCESDIFQCFIFTKIRIIII